MLPIDSPLYTQLTLSAIATWLLERAKLSPYFPWITKHTKTLNRVVAIALSGLTSLGVTFTSTGNWQAGSTFVVTVPGAMLICLGLWHWLQSFVLQQMIYHAAVKPKIEQAPVTVNVKGDLTLPVVSASSTPTPLILPR